MPVNKEEHLIRIGSHFHVAVYKSFHSVLKLALICSTSSLVSLVARQRVVTFCSSKR